MRKTLARICIFIVAIAFILLCIIPFCDISPAIPIVLFVIAIILFFVVKQMKPDEEAGGRGKAGGHSAETGYFDNDEAAMHGMQNTKTERTDK